MKATLKALKEVNNEILDSETTIANMERWQHMNREDKQDLSVEYGKLAAAKKRKLEILNQLIQDIDVEKEKVCDTIPDEPCDQLVPIAHKIVDNKSCIFCGDEIETNH